MIDLKKKCWRHKVTAEITMSHIQQIAVESGSNMSAAEVAEFFNRNGRAQDVWTHMMRAGEHYIKASLETESMALPRVRRAGVQASMVQ